MWNDAAVPSPDLLVVVVAYNNTEDLRRSLAALQGKFAVLVVDNAADRAVARLAADIGADYVPMERNLGFAGAVNEGLLHRNDRDVLLLNPDALVAPEAVARLHAELRSRPRCAAVAPRLTDGQGCEQRNFWPVPTPVGVWLDALGLARLHRPRNSFVTGAVLLLRAEAVDDIGTFDDRFFMYAEECDWQLRAGSAGWTVDLVDDVAALHKGGGSTGDPASRQGMMWTSMEAFARKWYGVRGWRLIRAGSFVAAARRFLVHPSDRQRRVAVLRTLRGPVAPLR